MILSKMLLVLFFISLSLGLECFQNADKLYCEKCYFTRGKCHLNDMEFKNDTKTNITIISNHTIRWSINNKVS